LAMAQGKDALAATLQKRIKHYEAHEPSRPAPR